MSEARLLCPAPSPTRGPPDPLRRAAPAPLPTGAGPRDRPAAPSGPGSAPPPPTLRPRPAAPASGPSAFLLKRRMENFPRLPVHLSVALF